MISTVIKVIVSIMMSIVLMLVPTACGGNNTATTESAQEEATEISDESSDESSGETSTEGSSETSTENSSETSDENKEESSEQEVQEEEKMIYAYIGGKVLTIEPADNSSAEAFMALLGKVISPWICMITVVSKR